ncbi:MAG: HAD hydrolase family protein [Candidatus Delongbacteria bacterium]|nr:HAD hydrolase family protein [Candidatus Delongbacteria bacterium]
MPKEIKLVILDVDGVMTDGKIYYGVSGELIKRFSAKDGFFIKHVAPSVGINFAIITGGFGDIVRKRATVLGIDHVYAEHVDKEASYFELKDRLHLEDEEIAYIGDDWFDWSAMKHAGFKGAPLDADEEIKKRVDVVTKAKGGNGVVREFLYYIMERDNKLEEAKSKYFD